MRGPCVSRLWTPGSVGTPPYGVDMRLLHTSDWHLGRALHQHNLGGAQAAFVDHLVEVVARERVDVVLLSGDVHDRALPPVEAMQLFDEALRRLRDTGAAVVAISGNHDAPARLGDKAGLLDRSICLRTDPRRLAEPLVLDDDDGPVAFYAIPYLEPAAVRGLLPGEPPPGEEAADVPASSGSHTRVLAQAMRAVHADRAARGGRSVALAHAWVTGGQGSDSERDITVGGVANVPSALFDGVDYTALGHLHRPQVLRDGLRYSGSPLPYSFSEAGHDKLSWLVELGPRGLSRVEAVPAPVHRPLSALTGTLEDLLASPAHAGQEAHFVAVTLTDAVKPVDAMTSLRRRFPFALTLAWQPAACAGTDGGSYAERTSGRSDVEIAEAFVAHVRSAADDDERALLRGALDAARLAGVA
jgi:exonuclease SbcD